MTKTQDLQPQAIESIAMALAQSLDQAASAQEREDMCEAVLASVAGALGAISVMRDEDNPSDMVKLAHKVVEMYIAKQS